MLRKYAELEILDARMGQDGRLARTAHRHNFQYEPKLGFLYVRSRAISSRTNDNFDHFPAEEIRKAWRTFIGKPVFVNHHNSDHRRARGVIIDAALHEDVLPDGQPDTWVEVLMEVDAVRFPKLAKAILAGEIDRTSMGTDVAYSVCSVCGNKATNPAQYCRHIPAMKGQKIRRKTASGDGTEDVLVYEKCVSEGSLVTTSRGLVAIEDIQVGDEVLTRRGWRHVAHSTFMGVKETVEVTFDDGRSLVCTPDHRIATVDGWTEAALLLPSTRCFATALSAVASPPVASNFDARVLVGVGVPSGAVGAHAHPVVPAMQRRLDDLQVGSLDAGSDSAGVVDLHAVDVVPAETDDRSVDHLFAVGATVDEAVSVVLADRPSPDQTCALPVSAGKDAFELRSVVSVTHGATVPVYDLGVEGEHEFVANGIVVHNCYGLGFFENSLLVEDPADPTAYFLGVDDRGVGGGYTGNLAKAASKTAARSLVCGRCNHQWDSRAQYNIACPKCGAEESVRVDTRHAVRDESMSRQATAPEVGHEGHDISYVSMSHGSKTQCDTCRVVLSYTNADGEDMGYIPATVHYSPTASLRRTAGEIIPVSRIRAGDVVENIAGYGSAWTVTDVAPEAGGVRVFFSERPQGMGFSATDTLLVRDPAGRGLSDAEFAERFPSRVSDPNNGPGWCPVCDREVVVRGGRLPRHNYNKNTAGALCEGSGKTLDEAEAIKKRDMDAWRATQRNYSLAPRRSSSLDWWEVVVHWRGDEAGLVEMGTRDYASAKGAAEDFATDPRALRVSIMGLGPSNGDYHESIKPSPVSATKRTAAQWRVASRRTAAEQDLWMAARTFASMHVHDSAAKAFADWYMNEASGDDMERAFARWEQTGAGRAASKLAYGETPAPPKVDTMRSENCPICGDTDGFNGDKCSVCGYLKPPDQFMDPDLTKAQEVDLRQEHQESAVGDSDMEIEDDDAESDRELGEEQFSLTKPGDDPADKPLEEDEVIDSQGGDDDLADDDEDELVPVEDDEGESPEDSTASPSAGDDEDEAQDSDVEKRQDDGDTIVVVKDKDDPEGSDDPEERKRKRKLREQEARSRSARVAHGEGGDVAMRPALRIIAEQQAIIDSQGKAIDRLASATGVSVDDLKVEAGRKVAALRRTADAENPAQPVPEPAAEAPAQTTDEALGDVNPDAPSGGNATDDLEEVGATSETDVTPDAVVDVQAVGEVSPDQLDLSEQDVTKPVAGTTDVNVADTRVEGDVEAINEVRTDTAFPIDDPSQTKTVGSQRTFASLRLARLRLEAGIVDDADDLTLGQQIEASSMSDESIANEVQTLTAVVAAKKASSTTEQARHLVPRSATRATPSLATGGSAAAPIEPMAPGFDAPDPGEVSLFD